LSSRGHCCPCEIPPLRLLGCSVDVCVCVHIFEGFCAAFLNYYLFVCVCVWIFLWDSLYRSLIIIYLCVCVCVCVCVFACVHLYYVHVHLQSEIMSFNLISRVCIDLVNNESCNKSW